MRPATIRIYLTLSPCSSRDPVSKLINLSMSSKARSLLECVSVGTLVREQMEPITCLNEKATFSLQPTYSRQVSLQYFCIFLGGSSGVSCSSGRGRPIFVANDNIFIWAQIQSNLLDEPQSMISLKRQCPSLNDKTIILDEEDQRVSPHQSRKKVKTNSETQVDSSPYDAIPEVPTIKLTVEQMNSDPLAMIKQLQAAYFEFGAVKITASDAWNSPFTFGNVDRPITVRMQTLQELKQGKVLLYPGFTLEPFFSPFEQKVQSMRIGEFKQKAYNFSKTYKFKTSPKGRNSEVRREHEYWNLVTQSKYESDEVTVEYGADLSSSLYGSGFPTRKIHNWLDADFEYESNLFNLNNLYKSPNSLLRVVEEKKDKVSGITIPWVYVGMQFATFCWHVEDLFLRSVNYNHLGQTKTWYVIPGSQKENFDLYVKQHYEGGKKKNLLQKITLMIDPLELMKAGIKVYKVQQRPRDYVFTFLKAYHCGFSHGFNITEAVNFACYGDIDCIKEALRFNENQEVTLNKKMRCQVLSYEWMIYETINQKLLEKGNSNFQKVMREYRRILNREYVMVKGAVDKHGQYKDVKVISSKKKYHTNMCTYCKNYLYLSSLECAHCHKNLCERHLKKCECPRKSYILNVRELNSDRAALREVVPLIVARTEELK